ncbi:hypothetical protein G7Y89_g4826 [Cudoniella acicularis]|uniref:Uncharacterized protein n=1 Tax=Cudoniella acicularis TaxID=354080 RepID=A0A8H4RNN4_9HELO|nr:hypothetical protein G7Y89_g4826 [Cudoniella acicularis]
MSTEPDLTLPDTAPVSDHYDTNEDSKPVALYTLVDLTENDFQELHRVSDEGSMSEDNVRIAPRARFVGEPLRAVYDYHLELAKEGVYNTIYFIVAIDPDWRKNGVLLVTLSEDCDCKVDSFRIKAQASGLSYVNLNIGNTSWEEEKECYEIGPGEGDKDSNAGDEDIDDGSEDENGNFPSKPDDPGSPTSGPIPPTKPPYYGEYIGVYVIEGLNPTEVMNTVEVGPESKHRYYNRLQAILPAGSADPVAEAFTIHPSRCERNKWLDKRMIFVVDTLNPENDGIILASLGGVVEGQELPRGATQRVPFNARECTQKFYCGIRNGVRDWAPKDLCFGLFPFSNESRQSDANILLDPKYGSRREWERLEYEPGWDWGVWGDKPPYEDETESLQTALKRWPYWCWKERLHPKFVRDSFICLDTADFASKGVLLVKLGWDGDVSGVLRR